MHYFMRFFKKFKILRLIFASLDEKRSCLGIIWENFESFQNFLNKIGKWIILAYFQLNS